MNTTRQARASKAPGMAADPCRKRQGSIGSGIRFALGECSLGSVLVAQSTRGICAIQLGDAPEPLLGEFLRRFPSAEAAAGDAAIEQGLARVVSLIEAPGSGLELPLDIQGTAFQKQVWTVLRRIPPGTTLSYAEVAKLAGVPGAARAVAGACAANALAVAIPCHRVVRGDGGLSGYRWGTGRKRALLDRERG